MRSVAVALTLLVLAPAALAVHGAMPQLAAAGGAGGGWAAWKVDGVNATFGVDLRVTNYTRPHSVGIWLIDAQGARGPVFLDHRGPDDGVLVHVAAPGGPEVRHDALAPGPFRGSFGYPPVVFNGVDGPVHLLVWTAGDHDAWSATLRGNGTLLASGDGENTTLVRGRDFRGLAQAEAHRVHSGARAMAAAEATTAAADGLFGIYGHLTRRGACVLADGGDDDVGCVNVRGAYLLSMDGPDGLVDCSDACAKVGAPAGAYALRATGAEASTPLLNPGPCPDPRLCRFDLSEDHVFGSFADAVLPG